MTDFLLQARDLGLYRALSPATAQEACPHPVGEMATYSGGCEMDLSLAPLKYAGLQPWEILVSEAQEHVSLAVDPKKWTSSWNWPARWMWKRRCWASSRELGKFRIRYGEKTVAYLDMDFLHGVRK